MLSTLLRVVSASLTTHNPRSDTQVLPDCEYDKTRNTINLVYDIHERGVKQGRENAKKNLKRLLLSTIHKY